MSLHYFKKLKLTICSILFFGVFGSAYAAGSPMTYILPPGKVVKLYVEITRGVVTPPKEIVPVPVLNVPPLDTLRLPPTVRSPGTEKEIDVSEEIARLLVIFVGPKIETFPLISMLRRSVAFVAIEKVPPVGL